MLQNRAHRREESAGAWKRPPVPRTTVASGQAAASLLFGVTNECTVACCPAQLDAADEHQASGDQVEQPEQNGEGDRLPMSGRAKSTAPKAADTRPPRMNRARVPAASPRRKAAKIWTAPATMAQLATINTSTRAVATGQARATTPAATSTRPRSRCSITGPAVRLLKARCGLQAGGDKGVDGEHDDEGENRDPGPGEGDDPDAEGEHSPQDQ